MAEAAGSIKVPPRPRKVGFESKIVSKPNETEVDVVEAYQRDYKQKRKNITDRKARVRFAAESVSRLPQGQIESVYLRLLSPKEILDIAVLKITSDAVDGAQSVNAPTMGTIDMKNLCPTCKQTSDKCYGHPGYIQLNDPVCHPIFIKDIISILTCVCNFCSRLLLEEHHLVKQDVMKFSNENRRKKITDIILSASKGHLCSRMHGCPMNPVYNTLDSIKRGRIVHYMRSDAQKTKIEKNILGSDGILSIFDKIPDEDLILMGYPSGFKPSNLIIQLLVVIPPIARPPIFLDGEIKQDPLTKLYMDIVSKNNKFASASRDPKGVAAKNEAGKELVILIGKLCNNSEPDNARTSEFEGIVKLLKSKHGFVRQGMIAKRQDFTARTVIDPDSSLRSDEIRIPLKIAKSLTKPEIVNALNFNEITRLLRLGRITDVTRVNGDNHLISESNRDTFVLKYGDTANRWMRTGDRVMANRQPTLHKGNMLSFSAVVSEDNERWNKDDSTIKLPMSVTKSFNADFDGDEMNLHKPQGIVSEAELLHIASVSGNVISGQTSRPIIAMFLDAIISATLLTSDELLPIQDVNATDKQVHIKKYDFLQYYMYLLDMSRVKDFEARCKMFNVQPYTGRGLFSILLPTTLSYEKKSKFGQGKAEIENHVIIKRGILIQGIITDEHIGPKSGSILHVLYNTYNEDIYMRFITEATWVLNNWIKNRGFTIGIADCFPDDTPSGCEYKGRVNREIEKYRAAINSMGAPNEGESGKAEYEKRVLNYLGDIKSLGAMISGEVAKPSNALNVMSDSGAKGTINNTSQILGIIGQSTLYQKRMAGKLEQGRTLPYFALGEDTLESKGFIPRGYNDRLNPADMYFMLTSGREGVINSATKADETGQMQRQLQESLRDAVILEDGSVRLLDGRIIQAVYGYNGFSTENVVPIKIDDDTSVYCPVDFVKLANLINDTYDMSFE